MAFSNQYESYPPHRPQAHTPVWPFLVLLGFLALGGLIGWWWTHRSDSGLDPNAKPLPVVKRETPPLSEEQTSIKIYEENAPSVVHVTNLANSRNWYSLDVRQVPQGTGSGFVWDKEGHIVTNYHVVRDASSVKVTLADQSTYDARDVWGYPEKDIAVIWINAPKKKLHPIRLGSSHDLKVGQQTFAIGNPFGLDQTMTTGIISALNREIHESKNSVPIRGVIQTSAAINPGNSGGPLFDSDGRLIGMTTAILSPSGAFAGIGFAIPSDELNRIVPQLIQHGKVVRPRLGVQIAEDQLAEQVGVEQGALIIKVVPDSPADKAGLRGNRRDDQGQPHLGDIITAIDKKQIKSGQDLFAVLDRYKVGDTVTVTFIRDDQRQQVKVTLAAVE
jgi:S1-C subfamily serine protease